MKLKPILLTTATAWALMTAAQGATTFPDFIPFDPGQGASPEGVAVDKIGNVYVSVGTHNGDQIWKFTPAGEGSLLADFGPPGGGACGLAVDAEGNVYMARTPVAAPKQGVYKVDKKGNWALIPGTDNIVFPDGLAFDQRGNLYITEFFSFGAAGFGQGGIWRVSRDGQVGLWLRHETLTGLGPTLFPFPLGANGIAFFHGSLYVINSDKAQVVRVPVLPDGGAGLPEVWSQVEDVPESIFYRNPLFPVMLDGLALDVHGNVYVVSPSRLAVVRIRASDRGQETIAVFPQAPLDAPLSLTFGTGNGERQNLFVTGGGMLSGLVPGPVWPGPALIKIPIGIPGLPLP